MKKLLAAVVLLAMVCFSVPAIAFDYAVVVTWQTDSGRWCGCGPVQKVTTSYATEEEILDLAVIDSEQDDVVFIKSGYGASGRKYNLYRVGWRELKSYEYDAGRCIK
jgi:hypothetical protein